MAVKTKKVKEIAPATEKVETPTSLTKADIVEAATNNPALSKDEFTIADRTFKVVHLEFDEYLQFTTYLEPMFKGLASTVTAKAGVRIPGINIESVDSQFTQSNIMKLCRESLPEMATIVCNMQVIAETGEGESVDQSKLVTAKWIKKNVKSPFAIAAIVMKQIDKNNMISEFLSFFVSMLPMMMSLTKSVAPQQSK